MFDRKEQELPWLERHREALERAQVVKLFRETTIPSINDIIRYVGERYKRIRPPKVKGDKLMRRKIYELKRLELVYNIVVSRIDRLLALPPTRRMNKFHRTLIEMFVGDEYDEALAKLRRIRRMAREFWHQYRLLILSAESIDEAIRYRREGSGRILSLIKRAKKHIELLKRVREEIIKTHVVAEGLPIVVVAGIPSAGKSTLVRRLSTAEPEIAEYPFTTKTIIVGKVVYNDVVFYVVDTPGILDKPFDKLNQVERKALAALSSLPDIVLYLFDISPGSYRSIEEQLNLYRNIVLLVKEHGTPIIPVVNKIDNPDVNMLEKLRNTISNVIYISALHGQGINILLEEIRKFIKARV